MKGVGRKLICLMACVVTTVVSMQITVRSTKGRAGDINFEGVFDTVLDVKKVLVEQMEGKKIRLFYHDKQIMDENKKLSDCKVSPGDTVHYSIQLLHAPSYR